MSITAPRVAGQSAWPEPVGGVALLRLNARFSAAVPVEDRALAERVATARVFELPSGPWDPRVLVPHGPHPVAALVLRGAVRRDVRLGGRTGTQLVGPGEFFRPWSAAESSVRGSMSWSTLGRATVAVLGRNFVAAARRWPALNDVVFAGLSDQLDDAARLTALTGLPRVEDRVLGLFWRLADRWGLVRPAGIVIRLPLTHVLIGQLVAAKRPTVSLALTALAADGLLHRDAEGAWILSHGSAAVLEDDPAGLGGRLGSLHEVASRRPARDGHR